MGEIKITASISKEAWRLVKSGKAVLESGGVRELNGQFKELLKPVLTKGVEKTASALSGGLLGGANLISSVGCNVQCAFIQKGVNQANQKLDVVLNKMDDLCKAVGSLGQIQALSWLNCAVGIANLGVSIAGFYITSQKLDSLSEEIDKVNKNVIDVIDILNENELKKTISSFKKYMLDIYADIQELKDIKNLSTDKMSINERSIRSMLNEIANFLNELIDDFTKKTELNEVYCNMILSLTSLFVQEVQLFTSVYYYTHEGKFPPNYSAWEEAIEKVNSNDFLTKVKNYIYKDLNLMEIPLSTKKEAHQYTINQVRNHALQLEINKQDTKELTFEQYCNRDAYYTEIIKNTEEPIYLEDGSIGLGIVFPEN